MKRLCENSIVRRKLTLSPSIKKRRTLKSVCIKPLLLLREGVGDEFLRLTNNFNTDSESRGYLIYNFKKRKIIAPCYSPNETNKDLSWFL